MMYNITEWIVPSMYGDVKVIKASDRTCTLQWEKTSSAERVALISLEEHARKKGWIGREFRFGDLSQNGVVEMTAPIEKISKMLATFLKPGRKLVSAVRFTNGKMEEAIEAETKSRGDAAETKKSSALALAPVFATTVAEPRRGCPVPDFVNAEIRATQVLERFLDDQQLADYRKYNRFVAEGATTGHKYVISSRHSRSSLDQYHRSLYDLDDKLPLCVHDFSVPAAEELLTLLVCISLPGYENFVRYMPEA